VFAENLGRVNKKENPLVLKCNTPKLCLLTTVPEVETSLHLFQYDSSLVSVATGNFSSQILVFFGETGCIKNIFLRFARSIKILHHGKMLGISHSPGFSLNQYAQLKYF